MKNINKNNEQQSHWWRTRRRAADHDWFRDSSVSLTFQCFRGIIRIHAQKMASRSFPPINKLRCCFHQAMLLWSTKENRFQSRKEENLPQDILFSHLDQCYGSSVCFLLLIFELSLLLAHILRYGTLGLLLQLQFVTGTDI